jgi:uncharacterized membrane protein YdbT with pleckstrin-like domain
MAEKYFDDQFDDEEVLLVFRKHPVVMRRGFIFAMLILLLGAVPSLFNPTYATYITGMVVAILVGGIVMLPSWIGWYFSVFIVTDQRLIQITQKGLFNRSVIDMRLNQIQTVNYQVAGLQETLLGFGTLMMQTYVGDLVIHEVHHPAKIQKKVLEIMRGAGIDADSSPTSQPIAQQPDLREDEAEA